MQQLDAPVTAPVASPRPRSTLRFVVAALAAFVVVEGAVRVVEAGVSDEQLYASSIETHARQLRDGRTPDVLTVGSSSAGAAFWAPGLVGAGVACDAYSVWLEGPTMEDIGRYVTHTLEDLPMPRDVLIGVTMREFNATSTKLDNEEVGGFLETDRVDGVMGALEDQLAMIRMREVFQDPPRLGRAVLGVEDAQVGPDGHHLTSLDRVIAEESAKHRRQEIDEMDDFRLRDADLRALDELIEHLDARGADVTVVNLPVTDLFIELTPNETDDYLGYLDAVESVARRAGAPFVDGHDLVPLDAETQFADVNHLNRDGARAFTTALVEDDVLPLRTTCPEAP
jgi:hypothetical protein